MKGRSFICVFCQRPVRFTRRDDHHCPGLDELRAFMSLASKTRNAPQIVGPPRPRPEQLRFPADFFNSRFGELKP